MSIYNNNNLNGELWLRDLKGKITTANNFLSSVYSKYQYINSNFYSKLTSNNIKTFDVFYDVIHIDTDYGSIFEKIYIENEIIKPFNKENNFIPKTNSDVSYWFDEMDNKIYYTNFSYNSGDNFIANTNSINDIYYTGKSWVSNAMSIDGQYQTALAYGDHIYKSNDYGNTWTVSVSSPVDSWQAIAISYDGQYQTAIAIPVYGSSTKKFYTSINYGNTWNIVRSLSAATNWSGISMSGDGQYQTATVYGGNITKSSDYGQTWSTTTNLYSSQYVGQRETKIQLFLENLGWTGVGVSSSGQYQVAVPYNEHIFVSSDYGNSWQAALTSRIRNWSCVGISGDGKYQTAANNRWLVVSSDYGRTWNSVSYINPFDCTSIKISIDGQYQVACDRANQFVLYSSDYGQTWSQKINHSSSFLPTNWDTLGWRSVAISGDGRYISAVEDSVLGTIYTSSNFGNNFKYFLYFHDDILSPIKNWSAIAISSDGKYQLAGTGNNDHAYVSSDYGKSWKSIQPWSGYVKNVSMSKDGRVQAISFYDTIIYSNDYGNTWGVYYTDLNKNIYIAVSYDGSKVVSSIFKKGISIRIRDEIPYAYSGGQTWNSVAISSDAKVIYATTSQDGIYKSIDYGHTFTLISWLPVLNWERVATSQDGRYVTGITNTVEYTVGDINGYIYVSKDYGNTWTLIPIFKNWTDVRMSPDGKFQLATADGGYVYQSQDYGNTWSVINSSGSKRWTSIAMTDDYEYFAATVYGGYIYNFNYLNGFKFYNTFNTFDCNYGIIENYNLFSTTVAFLSSSTDRIKYFNLENPMITYNSDTKIFNISSILDYGDFGMLSLNIKNKNNPEITEINVFVKNVDLDLSKTSVSSVNN